MIKRRGAKKRRPSKPKPECAKLRCKRRPVRLGWCNTHLLREADAAFSLFVRQRDGKCLVCGSTFTGRLQCMHVVSRRYRATRWDPGNAVTGCHTCHNYYTLRPLEWEAWVEERFGEGTWARLRTQALRRDLDWRDLAERFLCEHAPRSG